MVREGAELQRRKLVLHLLNLSIRNKISSQKFYEQFWKLQSSAIFLCGKLKQSQGILIFANKMENLGYERLIASWNHPLRDASKLRLLDFNDCLFWSFLHHAPMHSSKLFEILCSKKSGPILYLKRLSPGILLHVSFQFKNQMSNMNFTTTK